MWVEWKLLALVRTKNPKRIKPPKETQHWKIILSLNVHHKVSRHFSTHLPHRKRAAHLHLKWCGTFIFIRFILYYLLQWHSFLLSYKLTLNYLGDFCIYSYFDKELRHYFHHLRKDSNVIWHKKLCLVSLGWISCNR